MVPFTAPPGPQDFSLTAIFEGLKQVVAASTPQDPSSKSAVESVKRFVTASAPQSFSPQSAVDGVKTFIVTTIPQDFSMKSSLENVRAFAVTSSQQDLSPESVMETIKAFFEKLARSLSGAWASINWDAVKMKVQHFAEVSWEFIENANLLSPQKLTGYGLLVSSYYPIVIHVVVKLGMVALILLSAIFSAIIQFLGLILIKLLGFTSEGIRFFSPASSFQSRNYGAFTPARSSFSRLQSMGARRSVEVSATDISAIETVLIALARVVAAAAGVYLIVDDFVHPAA